MADEHAPMFKLFGKNETRRLETEYRKKLEYARDLQRSGDIEGFAAATAAAEEVRKRLDELERTRGSK